jgi:hypothetical protein
VAGSEATVSDRLAGGREAEAAADACAFRVGITLVALLVTSGGVAVALWRGIHPAYVVLLAASSFGWAALALPETRPTKARIVIYFAAQALLFAIGVLVGPSGGLLVVAGVVAGSPWMLKRALGWGRGEG